jgi:AcrR family transcriptional regulator
MMRHVPRAQRRKAEVTAESGETTRTRLLEAAAEVFAEAGYQQAKVRQICARARANIALINYHFGGKMGLYAEVLQQSAKSGHVEAIHQAMDLKGPPEEILRAIIKARIRGLRAGSLTDRQFRIVLQELAHPTPALTQLIDNVSRPIYKRVLELTGELIGLPPFAEKTRLCAHSIMGQIMLYALAGPVLKQLWPELKMTPAQLDRIADHIADFSLGCLRELRDKSVEPSTRQNGRGRK